MSETLTATTVWKAIDAAIFAVMGHVTPAGKPRTSGVMYAVQDRRIFVAVDSDSWKARQIHDGDEVSMTVTVPRGGVLPLLFPIPPATITFNARATMYAADSVRPGQVPAKLIDPLPADQVKDVTLLELAPQGHFLTYGIGVSLRDMRDPAKARGRVLVA